MGAVLQNGVDRRGLTGIGISTSGSETGKLPRTAEGLLTEEPEYRP